MSRERRALAAFLVLAAVATVPAVLLHPGSDARAAAHPARLGSTASLADVRTVPEAGMFSARMMARRAVLAARSELTVAAPHGDPAQICTSVPRYPAALRVEQRMDQRLLQALGAVPGVPPVTKMERFSLGRSAWLGGDGLPTVFGFYAARMRPIGFAAMSASVRREIGVRPTGSVDSPPLLYVNRTSAALVQGSNSGVVRLTLFCGPIEL